MVKRIFAMIVPMFVFVACSDELRAVQVLKKQGFSEITTTGFAPLACSDSDTYSTGFRATNPNGMRVKGVVCCGVFKSCTVRF